MMARQGEGGEGNTPQPMLLISALRAPTCVQQTWHIAKISSETEILFSQGGRPVQIPEPPPLQTPQSF